MSRTVPRVAPSAGQALHGSTRGYSPAPLQGEESLYNSQLFQATDPLANPSPVRGRIGLTTGARFRYVGRMTYCLGIVTKEGLVMAADSRTNAGHDQVNIARKMHTFCRPGERALVLLGSGSLSCTQSIVTKVTRDFDRSLGLAVMPTMYDAARLVGEAVREVAELDRPHLERDHIGFNVHFILGGQIGSDPPELYLIYPQGNPLRATEESSYLQVGETKYGRPILDRGVRFDKTTLADAARYALISLDSTMKSNATVGPPIDLLMYRAGELDLRRRRRLEADDPLLTAIRSQWDRALREAIQTLPIINLQAE
jgi:putative proteasome-type protease